jgi:hypothetical protein
MVRQFSRGDSLGDAPPVQYTLRSVIWRRLDLPGLEYCELTEVPNGWTLRGQIVLAEQSGPASFRYLIVCDAAWATTSVTVEARREAKLETLTLHTDGEHRWWEDNEQIANVRGCVDVDLGFTPATNTIAIRRLSLGVGEGASVTAAWVGPDRLVVRPLTQRYARVSATTYDYESRSGFTTRLTVDDAGLVTEYPPLWTRVSYHR